MRYFEDFTVGATYELGTVCLTESEILEFARRYDPQPFHVDLETARQSSFGGLIASGWQTASSFMRCYVDGLLVDSACEGSPGVDEMRFPRPVRAGDKLTARVTVLGSVPSPTRPDTGIVRPRCELVNADGVVVFSMILHSIFRRRGKTAEKTTGMEAVSDTARWTAAARALESEREDALFVDPWARDVAGDKGFSLLDRYAGAGTVPFIAVRTKFMDDAITTTLAERGIRQVVLVAAGMDTRAGRLAWPDGVVLYELDRPGLFGVKSQLLPSETYAPRCAVRRVAVDLTADWVRDARDAGLDTTQPTLWVAEGLFFFLREEAVRGLLAVVRELSAPGSVLVGDFVSRSALTNPLARGFMRALEEDGSPWRFGTDEPEALLDETGWRVTDLRQPGEDGAAFGRWPYPVPPRDLPSAPRSFLFTAEAG